MYLQNIKHYLKFTTIALLLIAGVLFSVNVKAAILPTRSLTISDSTAGASGVTYVIGFTRPNSGLIGSFELEICSNDPYPGLPCTVPTGFNFNGGTIASQTGITDFTVGPGSTSNKLIFSRPPSVVANGFMSVTLTGVSNPSATGSYYGRIQTFATNDGSGPPTDASGLAFAIARPMNVQTYVPPYLLLCVAKDIPGLSCTSASGDFVNMGELSHTRANTGYSQMMVGTNVGTGFTISVIGTPPTSGNNVIDAMASLHHSQPGNNQFGINLVANSNPGIGQDPAGPGTAVPVASYSSPNNFKFVSGETLVSSNTVSNYRKFTVSYLINRERDAKPGIYNTVILYAALASF